MGEGDGFEGTREEMDRAIRRLNVLEYLILGFLVLVALLGGAAVAFMLSAGTDLPFRATWAVLSFLLLVVPGILVLGRDRIRVGARRKERDEEDDDVNPRGTEERG
jgi:predicted lysophospholipase L1 biosynthesis ABC-type transport system permease subunit